MKLIGFIFCLLITFNCFSQKQLFFAQTGTPSVFTPASLPGLVFWVSADAITGLSDGDPVSTWVDHSGNGFDATASGGDRPKYKTGILNGLPVVRFGSTSLSYMTASIGTFSQPYTYFVVVKCNAGSYEYILDGGSANTGALRAESSTTVDGIFAGSSLISNSVNNTNWNYIGVTFNGASTLFSVNGSESTPGNPGTSSITNLSMGAYGGSIYPLDGDIAEVIYCDGAMSSGNRTLVYTYLAAKYGL